jgi:hypothetical protein
MPMIPARTWRQLTTVRAVNPLAAAIAARLATLTGRDINGARGTVRIGEKSTRKVTGYLADPQSFKGMASKGAQPGGAVRAGLTAGLPGTQAPYSEASPLLALIASTQNPITGAKK